MINRNNSWKNAIKLIGIFFIFSLFQLYDPLNNLSFFPHLLLFIIFIIIWTEIVEYCFRKIDKNKEG